MMEFAMSKASPKRYGAYRPHARVPYVDDYVSPDGEVGVSMTRQEFAEECDINNLMARYEKTGLIPQNPHAVPLYIDTVDMPDLMQAMAILHDAEMAFSQLPAVVRREFDNDPTKFVEFAQDRKNLDKLREWGLAAPVEAPKEPLEVRVVEPKGSPGAAPKDA